MSEPRRCVNCGAHETHGEITAFITLVRHIEDRAPRERQFYFCMRTCLVSYVVTHWRKVSVTTTDPSEDY